MIPSHHFNMWSSCLDISPLFQLFVSIEENYLRSRSPGTFTWHLHLRSPGTFTLAPSPIKENKDILTIITVLSSYTQKELGFMCESWVRKFFCSLRTDGNEENFLFFAFGAWTLVQESHEKGHFHGTKVPTPKKTVVLSQSQDGWVRDTRQKEKLIEWKRQQIKTWHTTDWSAPPVVRRT